MIHELKIAPKYFEGVISGRKTFEVRKDDGNYQENDVLILKEYDNNSFTGNEYAVIVTYVQHDEYCKDGYCILSFKRDNYRNTLRVIRSLGYNTEVFDSIERTDIFFYKDSKEEKIIYAASYEKDQTSYFNVHYGCLSIAHPYDEDERIACYFYDGTADATTEDVIKEIEEVDFEIDQEYDYGDERIYFTNAEMIIEKYVKQYNYRKIE